MLIASKFDFLLSQQILALEFSQLNDEWVSNRVFLTTSDFWVVRMPDVIVANILLGDNLRFWNDLDVLQPLTNDACR